MHGIDHLVAGLAWTGVTREVANPVQSVFVSPGHDLAFAINIPDDSSTDVYFTLAASLSVSWAAVGLGSDVMQNALVLMVYSSADSKNVTFSPRLSTKHQEPVYYPVLEVEALPGTGVTNGTLIYSARCSNCRQFPHGQIDVSSTAQNFIFATGPGSSIQSDDPAANIKFHNTYGAFTINLATATGPSEAPVLNSLLASSSSSGTVNGKIETGKQDWVLVVHAIAMIACFVGMMPFGVVLLRVFGLVRWHGINQFVALAVAVVGAALGLGDAQYYNRTKNYANAHEVLGLILVIAAIAQFLLGFFHHRIFKRTQQATKMAPIHVWLGRVLIPAAVVNGFLGFPLALYPHDDYILLLVVVLVIAACFGVFVATRYVHRKRLREENVACYSAVEGTELEAR